MDFQSIKAYFEQPRPKAIPKKVAVCYILHSLAEKDCYGTGLIQAVEKSGKFLLTENALYSALKFLESGGKIEGYWQKSPQGKRPRRFYKLAEKGWIRAREMAPLWREWKEA